MTVKLPRMRLNRDEMFGMLYLVAFIIRFFTNISKVASALIYVFVGLAMCIYILNHYKNYQKFVMVLLGIDFLSIIAGFVNGNNTYTYSIYCVSPQMFGIVLCILLKKNKMWLTHLLTELMYWFITVKVFLFPYADKGVDLGISQLAGKNSVSVIMIFCCAIDIWYRSKNSIAIGYIKFLFGIAVSYITDSSGGILCFTIMAVGMFTCGRNKEKISWVKISAIATGGGILLLGLGYIQRVIEFLSDDNSRFAIWGMYKNAALSNLKSVVFGGYFGKYEILLRLKNIHNTFLNWHGFYGLIPTFFYMFITGKCIWYICKNKLWYSLVIMSVLIIRAMTDSIDYVYMSLIVCLYLSCSDRHNTSRFSAV